MPGKKGASGRLPKSTAQHLEDGTYREHRHGKRVDSKVPSASLPVPGDMGEHAAELWKRICATLPKEIITKLDSDALRVYCETWEMYRILQPQFAADPLDKDLRLAWSQIVDRLEKLGRQFGWTPQTRASLQMPAKNEDEIDPMAIFLKRRADRN